MIKLSEDFIESYRHIPVPWGPLGYIVYKRTYSRNEEWFQTVARCVNGILDIGGVFTQEEAKTLYDYVFNLKCCFSGRCLWQLGTSNVQKIGADSLQNCWAVAANELEAFTFTFNQLMLGGGVGFNIEPEKVYELPPIKYGVSIQRKDENDVDFIVPDNREGWVELLRKILECFFITGKNLTYSTVCIRQKGKPISTFGGQATGSEHLVSGMQKIVTIVSNRIGNKLRPIDCLDIFNIIGSIVVSGNVRRSAELAAGSPQDILYLRAKNWKNYSVPNWRNMSNNSIITSDIAELCPEFWAGYHGNGEAYGLINLDLCKSHGRLIDGNNHRLDPWVVTTNPCGEIPLEAYEACNLSEVFLPNIHSKEELFTATELMYKVCKTVSKHPFSDPKINSTNHRLGIGLGGVLQSYWIQEPETLGDAYKNLEDLDYSYSRELGIGTSIKLTTVKPSGTLSLLAGVTPGIHPAYSQYYIRRVRFSSTDRILDICKKAGYSMEPEIKLDGSRDLDTIVVSFPIKTPKNTILAKNCSAIDQLNFQNLMQTYWADNSVSCTCYYKPEELPSIKKYLEKNYNYSIKSISFLLHEEHGFKQAPYEEINKEKYDSFSFKQLGNIESDNVLDLECSTGACPVR